MPERKNRLQKVSIRLVKDGGFFSDKEIHTPGDAVDVVGDFLKQMDREVVCVINLRSNGIPINCHIASIGAINYALIEPREIFKTAILSNATSIIVMHCHPSGSLLPSKEDMKLTEKLIIAGMYLSIPISDHIIVGAGKKTFFSMKEQMVLPIPKMDFDKEVTGWIKRKNKVSTIGERET